MSEPLKTPDDRELSPLTGFTRRHWVEITGRLLAGVLQYADRETGRIELPGPREPALAEQLRAPGGEVEAFERTAMVAAAWIAGTGRTDLPGYDGDVAEPWRRGLRRFIDPKSADHAGPSPYSSRRCGAGIVLAMLLAPEALLDPLPDEDRELLAEHLAGFVERRSRECNTLLFSMMPAAVLERLGAPYNRELLDTYFDTILSLYDGDGWFNDGWNRQYDHYNFWGFQLYLHAMMVHDRRWRDRYAGRVREITRAHERTLPYWFGADGGPIPKGRSLNYRFATVSGLAWSQLSGLASLEPGRARRIASGCLRYFWDHGCLSDRGLLEPGYRRPNAVVAEDYTDRGAPYWGATGLAALALPEDHPFWADPELPIPADEPGVRRCAVPGAKMVLKTDGDRGEARAIIVGEPFYHRRVWQAGAKYYQHAVSSTVGYALTGELGPELGAGRTGLSPDGRAWCWRTWPRVRHLDTNRARSEWDAWPAREGHTGTVVTQTLILDCGELHVVWHEADGPRHLAIGGYAARLEHGEEPDIAEGDDRLALAGRDMWSVMKAGGGVKGELSAVEVRPHPGYAHAHLFEGWAAYTQWASAGPVEPGKAVAVFVDAARRARSPEPRAPEIVLAPDAAEVQVDGRRWALDF